MEYGLRSRQNCLDLNLLKFFKEGNTTMKSSFLFFLLFNLITSGVALAQMSTRPSPKDMKAQEKTSFDKFYDRLKIGYFGVFSSPQLDDMKNGDWENAALSPEFSGGTNQDSWPTNIWHQVSFNYNFGAKMNFVFNPRFMTPLAHPVDMKEPEDRSLLMVEDFLFGFQGVVVTSVDKAFNLWIRPGIRLPTSRASRNAGQAGAGTLTNQVELAYNGTYDFNKTWQMGVFGQIRSWVIEDRLVTDRFRFYTAPFVQYTLDDTSRIQVYYETMLESDQRSLPASKRDPLFKDVWQNIFVGYNTDLTKTFNIMPFASVFVNDNPITDKSFWLGAWISYQIK